MSFNQTYPTVRDEITKIRSRLHDSGTLWNDTELLNYYQDGYRKILTETNCTKRFFIQEVPGRVAFSYCYPWEYEHGTRGIKYQFTKSTASNFYQTTYRWEAEQVEGIPTTNSNNCVTQLWELTLPNAGAIDQSYEFYLPNTERHRIERIAWNDVRLDVTSTKELDLQRNRWFAQGGFTFWWLEGLGPDSSFAVFSIQTAYSQEWEHSLDTYGMARLFSSNASRTYGAQITKYHPAQNFAYTNSGEADALITQQTQVYNNTILDGLGINITRPRTKADRMFVLYLWETQLVDDIADSITTTPIADTKYHATYTWEVDDYSSAMQGYQSIDPGVGTVRAISSPDRQFVPMTADSGMLNHVGALRDIRSTANSIGVWQSVIPNRALKLDDAPALLPKQMWKYLRYYTLAMALGRPGEGRRLDLSSLYRKLFEQGVGFAYVLGNLTFKERNYARETYAGERQPRWPRVQLPAQFPPITRAY